MTLRVGWLHDGSNEDGTRGGAELTADEFRAAAPSGIEIVDCPRGEVVPDLDRYVAHNVVFYSRDDLRVARPLVKYWHDVGPHLHPDVVEDLRANATHICCSPLQRDSLGLEAELVPPAVPLETFRAAAASRNGADRSGAISLGPWMNHGKHPRLVMEWANSQGGTSAIDFYGAGPLAPPGARAVDYEFMPMLLARYETLVHLPLVLEPFGRCVVEAWAAGCQVITNRLVGSRWWIEESPSGLESAAEDFWKVVAR